MREIRLLAEFRREGEAMPLPTPILPAPGSATGHFGSPCA